MWPLACFRYSIPAAGLPGQGSSEGQRVSASILFSTVGLMGNPRDPRGLEPMRTLAAHLAGHGRRVLVSDAIAPQAMPEASARIPESAFAGEAELVITVGGDGSILYAARRLAGSGVPLLGINRGRLGFLADIRPSAMLGAIDEVLRGEYDSEQRLLLRADILEDGRAVASGLALNDVAITRHDPGRMLEVRSFVDGHYLNTHSGDGFIIATPTGSTAYALSCGGPIVSPLLGALVLVPICPHTLSERPILIPASARIGIGLAGSHSLQADVSCDGKITAELTPGRQLRVQAAAETIELIHPRGYDYFRILREKLHWGRDHQSTGEPQG